MNPKSTVSVTFRPTKVVEVATVVLTIFKSRLFSNFETLAP